MSSAVRLTLSLLVGLLAALLALALGPTAVAPLAGWDAAALVYVAQLTVLFSRADATRTRRLAVREDPSVLLADVILLAASLGSLVGVGVLLAQGSAKGPPGPALAIAVSLTTVFVSWTVVHLTFAARYARLYYDGDAGGIDFNEAEPPRYADFAYLAFTIGMTFQVSDTDLKDKRIRATALRQALLAYVFGAVILATTINLVAGLTK